MNELMKEITELYEAHLKRMRDAMEPLPITVREDDTELEPNDDVLEDPSQA